MESQKQVSFSPHELVFESKFDVALRLSHGNTYLARRLHGTPSFDEEVLHAAAVRGKIKPAPEEWVVNEHIYPKIIREALNMTTVCRDVPDTLRAINISGLVLECQLHWINQGLTPDTQVPAIPYRQYVTSRWRSCTTLMTLLSLKNDLDDLIARIARSSLRKKPDEELDDWKARLAERAWWKNDRLQLRCAWSRHSAVIEYAGKCYFVPRSYLLLVHNKLCDTISILMYSAACPVSIYGCDPLEFVVPFLKELANLGDRYQQKFFTLTKVLEGIVIGETLFREEGDANSAFLTHITNGLEESIRYTYNGSSLQYLLQTVPVSLMHELGCLSKVMGHPFCDVAQGAKDLYDKTHEYKELSLENIHRSALYAKQDFIRHYIAKERKWPATTLEPGCPKSLAQAKFYDISPDSISHQRTYGPIKVEDYAYVNIERCLEFDWVENFLPHVKDRTISLLRSEVFKEYVEKDPDFKKDWKQTRLLLYYLLWPEEVTKHVGYIKKFVEGEWELLADYLVIRVVPKEKEHKVSPRGFGAKTALDRARGVVQEWNVSKYLDAYCPEQAMTLGEVELSRKLLGFRNLRKAYQGYSSITVNIDSSSWNNHFRHVAVAAVASAVLDCAYDIELFSKTMKAYEKSFVIMPDEGEVYYWDGQLGGIEGLNQYTWVDTYINQVKVCMEPYNFPYHILCRGDDLRVVIMVPPKAVREQGLDKIKKSILSRFAMDGMTFGHKIKEEDSYASECYFAFSKNAFVHDVEQPQTFRKIQKAYGANNAFLKTPDDYVASAFSNCHSASKTSPTPVACYSVACLWAAEYLTHHEDYVKLSDHELTALLQTPNIMGGFPVIYLHNFFVRAESDLLPPFLHLAQLLKQSHPAIGDVMYKFWCQKMADARRSFVGLLIDPYSLPLAKPTTATTLLRKEASKMVEKRTKNAQLSQLFKVANSRFGKHVCDLLWEANVFNVKLLSALYSCTPDMLVQELMRKFETGRSIYSALILGRGRFYADRVLGKCFRAEQRLVAYRLAIVKRPPREDYCVLPMSWETSCPYQLVQEIRESLWGRKIEGITHPPLQHLVLIGRPESHPVCAYTGENHFSVSFDIGNYTEDAFLFTVGRYTPFVGSITTRGLSQPQAAFKTANMLVPKLKALTQIIQWTQTTGMINGRLVSSNLHQVAEHLVRCYTQHELSAVLPFAGRLKVGKTTQHHVRVNAYNASIVPNTLLNIYTRAQGNSHSHREYVTSGEHYLVNFLQVYTHMVSVWAMPLWLGVERPLATKLWGVSPPCTHCRQPIYETPVVLPYTDLPDFCLSSLGEIGDKALAEVRADIESFDPSDYFCPEDAEGAISVTEAQSCITQHLINKLWRDFETVQEATTGHVMTTEGYQAMSQYTTKKAKTDITDAEMRVVPLRQLINDVALQTFFYLHERFNIHKEKDLEMLVAVIPSEFPWTHLLSHLQACERYADVQRLMSTMLRQVSVPVFDNPASYASVFASMCWRLLSTQRCRTFFIAQLNMSTHLILDSSMRRRITAFRWKVLLDSYKDAKPYIDRLDPHQQVVSRRAMMIGTIQDMPEYSFTKQAPGDKRLEIPLFIITDSLRDYLDRVYDVQEIEVLGEDGEMVVDRIPFYRHPWFVRKMVELNEWPMEEFNRTLEECSEDPDLFDEAREEFWRIVSQKTITVLRTDLVSCINRLKNEGIQGVPRRPRLPRGENIRLPGISVRGVSNKVVLKTTIPENTASTLIAEPDHRIPDDLRVQSTAIFDTRWMHRPYGSGNLSMSKYADIFEQIGLTDLPPSLRCYGLGDGYGGACAVLGTIAKESQVVYISLPGLGDFARPYAAYEVMARTGSCLSQSSNMEEYNDLTSEATYQRMEQKYFKSDIIVLDAESYKTRERHKEKLRLNMLHYVANYFIRTGVENSVLVLKFYIPEWRLILQILGKLGCHSKVCMILQCRSSLDDGELHLVAQLRAPVASMAGTIAVYPSQSDIRRVVGYISRIARDIREGVKKTNVLQLRVLYSKFQLSLSGFLPHYGWMKFAEKLQIPIERRWQWPGSKDELTWIREILADLSAKAEQLKRELEQVSSDPRRSTYDSLEHSLKVLEKRLTMEGFRFVLNLYRKNVLLLEAGPCINAYKDIMRDVPHNIRMNEETLDITITERSINFMGYVIDPFAPWMMGVRWAYSALQLSRQLPYGRALPTNQPAREPDREEIWDVEGMPWDEV
nr:MAG: L protein [Changping Tick Virus 3]